ncbi:MAG: YceI family protein [Anaeromyxobacter sp.]
MKKLLLVVAALAPAFASAGTSTWNVDPMHSRVGFAVKHLVISTVRGEFKKYEGKVVLDDADLTKSTVEATIDPATIDTGVADRDGHLRSPDFFDVAKNPTVTFKSTKVAAAGPGKLAVTGDLTLRGVTKPVVLDVELSPEVKGMYGETRRGVTATGKIDRKAFGLAWSKVVEAGPVVADEVTLSFELEIVKAQPKVTQK